MKKIDFVNLAILFFAISGLFYYGYEFYRSPIKIDDLREKEYLSIELKRSQIGHAIRYFNEKQYEEALLILEQSGINDNPYGLYLKGHIFFKMGRKQEGLYLIKEALQKSNVLYDLHYPNNIRTELEDILSEISKDDQFISHRHFISSKLKGGCG